MKFRFFGSLATVLVLCCVAIVEAQDKPGYVAPPVPAETAKPAADAAAAAFTGSGLVWITPKGAFDGKGRFIEDLRQFGAQVGYVANAHQYAEDANFCYYQENTVTSWWWALAKNPTGGAYAVWVRPGSGGFIVFSEGPKLPRAGDP